MGPPRLRRYDERKGFALPMIANENLRLRLQQSGGAAALSKRPHRKGEAFPLIIAAKPRRTFGSTNLLTIPLPSSFPIR
jgi:hypothetical protein